LPATSSIIIEDIQILDDISQPTSQLISQSTSEKTSQDFTDSKYNKSNYILSDKNIYIFKNGLFTRTLLPIDLSKEREILVECTTCSFKKIEKIPGFQSSNYSRHYKNKHSNIAFNKESEKTKLIKASLPPKKAFFNQSKAQKRIRSNTIQEFNKDKALYKVLNFIVENNLSFNILNSASFHDLLNYYNKAPPTINR
ncbi:hypothetical protein GQ53DRAFT_123307, partial [Thozetella sp. PMI_491]